ncbi:hypothetical protein E4U21_003077 [Claviceps maximensis]|nr:hypothetical protein E4U21_003077 [Claviceps maximensis]
MWTHKRRKITGATGLIGFQTLKQLLQKGYSVRAAVRTQAGFDRIASLECIRDYTSQLSSVVVPDNTVPGAYDEAVQGAKFIIHIASPTNVGTSQTDAELRETVIEPAMFGTTRILTAAVMAETVERVVITSSLASIASNDRMRTREMLGGKSRDSCQSPWVFFWAGTNLFTEQSLDADPNIPIEPESAYNVSKILALAATKHFLRIENPKFTIMTILPTFVFGHDEAVTDVEVLASKGNNSLLLGPLLGVTHKTHSDPYWGSSVHVDDVAEMHIRVLDESIKGSEDFIATAGSMEWATLFDIVQKRFSKECSDGVFTMDFSARPITTRINVDNTKAKRVLGMDFKPFEEQVVSLLEQYLKLRGSDKEDCSVDQAD